MSSEQIDWRKTVNALLDRANRPFVPIDKSFIQMPREEKERRGPLATFVNNGDLRGLKAYLLIVASASSPDENDEWYTSLSLQTWARAFGCFESANGAAAKTAATRILVRLQERRLIEKAHDGGKREIKVKLLAQNGSGEEYQRPTRRFIRLSHDFWKSGLDEKITLPSLAMLLVILGEKQPCELPSERMPEWYGWSADTAERGLYDLCRMGIIEKQRWSKETALSPTGYTIVNEYSVLPPFDKETLDLSRRERKGGSDE